MRTRMSKLENLPICLKVLTAFFMCWVALASGVPAAADGHGHREAEANDSLELRVAAAQRVSWAAATGAVALEGTKHVKLLAINDFHGQIGAGRTVGGMPVGSAPVLASYLKAAQAGIEDRTIIAHAGDFVGASPANSALMQDEPSIEFMNRLINRYCTNPGFGPVDPRCNIVFTLGNHEFDEGKAELLRLIFGGNHAKGPFFINPYPGSWFPWVCANVLDTSTGRTLLPPYLIKEVNGQQIAFIGAVLKETPTIVTAAGVAGVSFLDEADAINSYIPELKRQNVRAIVAMIHQGGVQTSYIGPTNPSLPPNAVTGPITSIVSRLDDEVDVVLSGHRHLFTNLLMTNSNGKQILVTQAFASGTAYADVDLEIDPVTKDIVGKSAAIVTTFANSGPGLTPDLDIAFLVQRVDLLVAPLVNQVIGFASTALTRTQSAAGESALGNLIADSQRLAIPGTDFAFMNPGGIRANIDQGTITWGEAFNVQPFGNSLVQMDLTGAQIYLLLEQQFIPTSPRFLQISGLTYTWNSLLPVGGRVVVVNKNGVPIDPAGVYRVTVNSFLAEGGDGFSVLAQGTNRVGGPIDLDAFIAFIKSLGTVTYGIEGRITRLN